ncbi:hypothetical protein ACOMHN_028014 [Nucella lapillus]
MCGLLPIKRNVRSVVHQAECPVCCPSGGMSGLLWNVGSVVECRVCCPSSGMSGLLPIKRNVGSVAHQAECRVCCPSSGMSGLLPIKRNAGLLSIKRNAGLSGCRQPLTAGFLDRRDLVFCPHGDWMVGTGFSIDVFHDHTVYSMFHHTCIV